ncbi:hypothetical protein [Mycoplasma struthionis]|uniref:Uncharacterized protein n=1 Tax=Mycoplasma struthionis TaxID=538220 RepID=A0A3G8LI79_9MOLU|nr:hypothetical protein [Mycoplasma struthionis]AZG68592.1 hypothetical protein EGN60_01235 [Mycoplasma struthionis]
MPVAMSCGSNSNADKTTTKNVETPDSTSKEGTEGAPAVEKENKNPESAGNQNGNALSQNPPATTETAEKAQPSAPKSTVTELPNTQSHPNVPAKFKADFSAKTNLTKLSLNKVSEIAKLSEKGIKGEDLVYLRAVKGVNFINHAKKLINGRFQVTVKNGKKPVVKAMTLNELKNGIVNKNVTKLRDYAVDELNKLKTTTVENNLKNGAMIKKGNNVIGRTQTLLNLLAFLYVNKDQNYTPKQAELKKFKYVDEKNKPVDLHAIMIKK